MNSRNLFQEILKYAVPALFAVLSIVLIVEGYSVESFDQALCGYEGMPSESGEQPKVIELEKKFKSLEIEQTQYFKYAGFTLLAMSIVMGLFVAGVIKRTISLILIPVFGIIAALMIYFTYDTVDTINDYTELKDDIYRETKQRMIDIKEAQIAFKKENGRYVKDLDELVDYVKNGKTSFVKADDRDVPDSNVNATTAYILWGNQFEFPLDDISDTTDMIQNDEFVQNRERFIDTTNILWGDSSYTELMCWKLGMITRDTIYQPVKEQLFTGPNAKRRDSEFPFSADSLKYMAYTQDEFLYFWRKIENVKDSVTTYNYRFEVRLRNPMKEDFSDDDCEDKDQLIMGSLDSDKITGNW